MGYVAPKSILEALESPDPKVREQAAKDYMESYNRYRDGMRSGIFGLLFGRALYPKRKTEGK